MLIPIGHDHSVVRRWPVATIGLMLACIALYGFHHVELQAARDVRIETYLQVIDYLAEHPWLELDDDLDLPDAVLEELAEIRRDAQGRIEFLSLEQRELDRRIAAWRNSHDIGPIWELGYLPSEPRPERLLTSLFMHGGVGHLVGNMLILFLVGPALEDRWGRPFFLAFYLFGGIAATLVHGFLDPRRLLPLVGASGAIAALMGASLLWFWRARLVFLLVIPPFFKRFKVPASFALLAWVLGEIAASWLVAEDPEAASNVASVAHVGGFFFGVVFGAGVQALGIEKRFLAPRLAKAGGDEIHQDLAEVHALLDGGRREAAWSTLEKKLGHAPADPDLLLAYWHLAVDLGRTDQAGRRLVRSLRSTLRSGDRERAADRMQLLEELRNWQPDLAVSPLERLGLAEDLARAGFEDWAADLLESLERAEAEIPEEARSRLRRLHERLDRDSAPRFAAGLESYEPHATGKAEL